MKHSSMIPAFLMALSTLGCAHGGVDPTRVQIPIHAMAGSTEGKLMRPYAGKTYRCVDFDKAGPGLEVVSYHRYGGPILGKLNGDPVVSRKFFTELRAASAIHLKQEQAPIKIGVAIGLAKRRMLAWGVIKWLLQTEVVKTRRHQGAASVRTGLRQIMLGKNDLYIARFRTYAEMYTNVRTVTTYDFALKIDRNTGEIWLGPVNAFQNVRAGNLRP